MTGVVVFSAEGNPEVYEGADGATWDADRALTVYRAAAGGQADGGILVFAVWAPGMWQRFEMRRPQGE